MKTYTVYIGENNETKTLELTRIKNIAGAVHEGFTLYTATGYWLGQEEETAVLVIHDEAEKIQETIKQLKRELKQDAIGYQVSPIMHFA